MENTPGAPSNLFDLHIDPQSQSYLAQTARWARFLSIVGFVFCGLFVLWGIFAGSIMSIFTKNITTQTGMPYDPFAGVGAAFLMIGTVLIAALYFFPCLYLLRFSAKMKSALGTNEQNLLTQSFGNLKSFYRFIGILTIIGLSLFALELIFVIIFAIAATR